MACWSKAVTKTICDSIAGLEQPPRDLEAGQPGHLDVEHHQVRAVAPRSRASASMPLPACADDLDAADLPEQEAQLVARQLLVVHDDGPEWFGHPCRLRGDLRRHDELRNHDARARALAGHAVELQLVVGAVDHAQPLVDVAQADAARP